MAAESRSSPRWPIPPVPVPTALGMVWNVLIITPRAILLLLHLWILIMVLGPPSSDRWSSIRRYSIRSAVAALFFLLSSVLFYGRTWSVLISANTFAAGACWLVSAVVMSCCAILIKRALARGFLPPTAPALGLPEQVAFAAMISPGFAIGVFLCVPQEVAPTLVFVVLAAYWLGVARIAVSRREGWETDQLFIRWGQPFLMGVGALVAIATLAVR